MLAMVNGPAMSTRKSGWSPSTPRPPSQERVMIPMEAATITVRKSRKVRFRVQKSV